VTLRHAGIDGELYRSLADTSRLDWDWASRPGPSSTAQTLAEQMTRLPIEDLLSGDYTIGRPNATLVASLMELLEPHNVNVAYVASRSSGDDLFERKDVRTLPHYGVNYSIQNLWDVFPLDVERWIGDSMSDLQLWSQLVAKCQNTDLMIMGPLIPILPEAIAGIPTELPLSNMHAEPVYGVYDTHSDTAMFGPMPKKLSGAFGNVTPGGLRLVSFPSSLRMSGEDGSVMWYRKGWVTTSPKVSFQIVLRPLRRPENPELTALDTVRVNLYSLLFATELVPKMADLTASGSSAHVDVTTDGLFFSFSGFGPVLDQLVDKVLTEFNGYNEYTIFGRKSESRLAHAVKTYRAALVENNKPSASALADRNILLSARQFSNNELLEVLDNVTTKLVGSSVKELFLDQPLTLTSLIMGNTGEKEARQTASQFVQKLHPILAKNTEDEDFEELMEHVVPVVKLKNPVELRMRNPDKTDTNFVTVVSLIAGMATVESRVELGIMGELLDSVAFSELRTQMQLGYVVSAGVGLISNIQYVSCVVQGDVKDADLTEAAIETVFAKLMTDRLSNMTDEDFKRHKESFQQSLMEPPLTYADEVSHFLNPILLGADCFALRGEMVRYLDMTGKDKLLQRWNSILKGNGIVRQRIVVKYFPHSPPERPSLETSVGLWRAAGVPDVHRDLLQREYGQTKVFDRADSTVREILATHGGYFSTEVHCHANTTESSFLARTTRIRPRAIPHFLGVEGH